MFTKVTVEMVKCMRDVVHQTKEEAIPGILEHGIHCSMSLKRNPFQDHGPYASVRTRVGSSSYR
eukprot:4509419-Prorocentrum_lima.AAC.1